MVLTGDLDSRAAPHFRKKLAEMIAANPTSITLDLRELNTLSQSALRALVFERGKLAADGRCMIEGASDAIRDKFRAEELDENLIIVVT